jgi:hypothetical protein
LRKVKVLEPPKQTAECRQTIKKWKMNDAESDKVMHVCVCVWLWQIMQIAEPESSETPVTELSIEYYTYGMSQSRHKCEGYIVPVQPLKHILGEEILL